MPTQRLMMAHVIADRLELEAGTAGPVAQRRPIKPDPLARIKYRSVDKTAYGRRTSRRSRA
jgi:hypothetical protein